jgi:hypothetical protein
VAKHLYLRKANNDYVSHCNCDKTDALIASPGQLDCPWCGCGWLFICGKCSKAFTFAEGVMVNESWQDTANRTIRVKQQRNPLPGEVEEWIGFMKMLLKEVEPGEQYVYFDGFVIPTTASGITIEGWHSNHDLDVVPQIAALRGDEVWDLRLCSLQWWQAEGVASEQ